MSVLISVFAIGENANAVTVLRTELLGADGGEPRQRCTKEDGSASAAFPRSSDVIVSKAGPAFTADLAVAIAVGTMIGVALRLSRGEKQSPRWHTPYRWRGRQARGLTCRSFHRLTAVYPRPAGFGSPSHHGPTRGPWRGSGHRIGGSRVCFATRFSRRQ